jgi:hypothetical protein
MNAESTTGRTSLNEDQQAIAEYFASEAYQRNKRRAYDPSRRGGWVLENFSLYDRDIVPTTSFCWGLLGLIGIVTFFGLAMPLEMELVEQIFNTGRPMFAFQAIVFQTLLFPAAISFSFATVTPMFWYGSIVFRFALAALMVLPGCFAFYLAASWTGEFPRGEFWLGFMAVMFVYFLTAGSVALTIQMWSPWALSHARHRDSPLPTLGTRSMMELTVIAAVGFAVIVSIDTGELMEALLFFAALGFMSSLAVISLLIAFLRQGHQNRQAAIISGGFAFGSAFLLTGFLAVMEFGWDSILFNFIMVSAISVYGAVLICGVMWLCLWWLRSCGWLCVNRKEQGRASEKITVSQRC